MPVYRLYPLGPCGAIIGPASDYYCDDDEAALELAEKLRVQGKDFEVWRAAIKVGNTAREIINPLPSVTARIAAAE